jgi:peptidoglycan/LPS O-acetylase OafA/YrhL
VLALADAASEGRDVIRAMLIVGLVFIAVIAIGTTSHYLRERRRRRRRQRPAY